MRIEEGIVEDYKTTPFVSNVMNYKKEIPGRLNGFNFHCYDVTIVPNTC